MRWQSGVLWQARSVAHGLGRLEGRGNRPGRPGVRFRACGGRHAECEEGEPEGDCGAEKRHSTINPGHSIRASPIWSPRRGRRAPSTHRDVLCSRPRIGVSRSARQRAPPEGIAATIRRLLLALLVAGNAAAIVWLWWHGGNVSQSTSTGESLTSVARITGLLGAYLALIQVRAARAAARARAARRLRPADASGTAGTATPASISCSRTSCFSIWGYALIDKLPARQGDLDDDRRRRSTRA